MKKCKRGYWTDKSNCIEAALKCTTKTEFKKRYHQAWATCRKNGWSKEACAHMVSKQVEKGFWNYDTCLDAAMKCKTKTEFGKTYPQAYRVAHDNGWDKEYDWFPSKTELLLAHHGTRKWTYETTYEEALKYKTRSEFQHKKLGAYSAAWKKGWLKDYFWMEDGRFAKLKEEIDTVYAYEFKEFNSVYIGRTIDIKRRDNEHRSEFRKDKNDIVYNYAKEHNIAVPEVKVLSSGISVNDGARLEGEWLDAYSNNGWTILNRRKTGGIGCIAFGKWNRTTCYEEAKKFKTRKEFRIKSSSAYKSAWKHGWLDDYTWFVNGHRKDNWFLWSDAS